MSPDTYYHIYNHANGDENLFRSEENYYYFLRQWAKYIEPVASTYAYCLMPNHFHFLIRTKDFEHLKLHLTGFENLSGVASTEEKTATLLSKTFSNLFNSYTKAYNKLYDRRGSLFNRPFKRKEITSDTYLSAIIGYIHRNPIHHGFCDDLESWPYSSYTAFLTMKNTKLKKDQVLDWFGGKESFREFHKKPHELPDKSLLIDF